MPHTYTAMLCVICGFIAVFIQMIIGGIRYKRWLPRLDSIISIFLSGAIFPIGIIFITFSIFEVPKIDITQYKIYMAIAGIVLIYATIHGITKEIKQE
jgi:uncharacterized membrane protein